MRKRFFSLLFAALLLVNLAGCGGSSKSSNTAAYDNGNYYSTTEAAEGYDYEYDYDEGFAEDYSNVVAEKPAEQGETAAEQKLIYTADAKLETKDIEPALEFLYGKIDEYGCIIENENVYNIDAKYVKSQNYYFSGGTPEAELTVRVPSAKYEDFVKGLKSNTDILYVQRLSSTVENMTRTYYDVQSRITALRSEEQWLLEFMDEAENVSEMLEIKDRLTEVQRQIDSYTTQINLIDYDVNYSTVNIELVEVQSYTESREATFGERLGGYFSGSGSAFLSFLEGALEVLIYLLPYLILGGLIAFIIVKIVKSGGKKRKAKNAFPPVQQQPVQPQTPQAPQQDEKKDE